MLDRFLTRISGWVVGSILLFAGLYAACNYVAESTARAMGQ